MEQMKYIEEQIARTNNFPAFKPGDQVEVDYNITEGDKQRIQTFKGTVLQTRGDGLGKTFTVRKISSGVGVERIFPFNSPFIEDIRLIKEGKVRRAKLFYLRKQIGKKSRIKEKSTY